VACLVVRDVEETVWLARISGGVRERRGREEQVVLFATEGCLLAFLVYTEN
jgi:hypothetical protein